MDEDDLIKALKVTENVAATIAEQHDDDCPLGEAARVIRDGCRDAHETLAASKGPAQVATDDYRRNWDGIFGAKSSWGQA
jgi:hypothetical protein